MSKDNSIKIGVISDTHGLLRKEVVDILKKCDYIIHGGDINNEIILDQIKSLGKLYIVKGNNDLGKWAKDLPKELYFNIGGYRFYLRHDKTEIDIDKDEADVVIFGHSHKYFCETDSGVLWLNPGSCGHKRFRLPITMAILEIRDENIEVEKIDI